MSLRTDLLPVVDDLRGLAGPAGFDVRLSILTIRTRTWSGGRRGVGEPTDSDLVLPQKYKARSVNTREIAGSGGKYLAGDIRFGPITPSHATGGYSPEQLAPNGDTGIEVIYLVTGNLEGSYGLVDLNSDKPFSSFLTLRLRRDANL